MFPVNYINTDYTPANGYHLVPIAKGEYGKLSKIVEEVQELEDAHNQRVRVMVLNELADLYSAMSAYLFDQFKGQFTMADIKEMSNCTDRAFSSGHRK